jgi:hypothetical protein
VTILVPWATYTTSTDEAKAKLETQRTRQRERNRDIQDLQQSLNGMILHQKRLS